MSYTELTVKGKTMLMGKEIPVISGGFGENEKCMLVRDIAIVHEYETFNLNKLINNNIQQFAIGIDLVDLKLAITSSNSQLINDLGFSQGQINASKNIYLLSQRGYIKLVAMMDNKNVTKWEVMGKLIDEYFTLREIVQQLTPFEQNVLVLLDDRTSPQAKADAAKSIKKIGRGEICDRAIITYDKIDDMLFEILQGQECLQFMHKSEVRSTFKEVLEYHGYIYWKKFPTKDGKRLERTPTMMPTEKFEEKFTMQGLAKIRPITKDNRGKLDISFTVYIREWIDSDEFISTFANLASKYIPQQEEE